jgi:hypothetical protein
MNKKEADNPEIDTETLMTTTIVTNDKYNDNANSDIEAGSQSETKNKSDNDIKGITSLIPSGWHVLQKDDGKLAIAEGDLNKDGIADKAFVTEESKELDSPRNLLIVFGNKDNAYTLSIKAEKAILSGYEGGGFGDPFDNIQVDRGSILLKFFGGSSTRWYSYYRFRYQDNGWYLIGATEGSLVPIDDGTMDNVEDDYNLLTGDYISRKLIDGKIKTIKGNRGKKDLLNLNNFDVHFESKSQF